MKKTYSQIYLRDTRQANRTQQCAKHRARTWRQLVASLGIAIFATPTFTGCGEDKVILGAEERFPTAAFSLVEVDDCEASADDALRKSLIATMNEELDREIKNTLENEEYYCENYRTYYGVEEDLFETVSDRAADGDTATNTAASPEPPRIAGSDAKAGESSDTNNQVEGVDEADLVKHDGKHIYIIDGEGFKVIDAFHGNTVSDIDKASIIADIKIDGQPKKLLLENNHLAVFVAIARDDQDDQSGWYYQPRECTYGYHCDFSGDGTDTLVQIYDVSTPERPELVRELKNNGALLASRKIGDAVFVALSHPAPRIDDLTYWLDDDVLEPYRVMPENTDPQPHISINTPTIGGPPPPEEEAMNLPDAELDGNGMTPGNVSIEDEADDEPRDDTDDAEKMISKPIDDYIFQSPKRCADLTEDIKDVIVAAYEDIRAENIKKIETTDLSAFRPTITDQMPAADKVQTTKTCLSSPLSDGAQYTSLLSFNLVDNDQSVDQDVIISKPGAIYVSETALYMSVRHYQNEQWNWFEDIDQGDIPEELSTIHKFALDPENARGRYAASGTVEGYVLNQFAMDEHKGHLRVASTSGDIWQEGVHAQLTVLKEDNSGEDGQVLIEVGKIDNIAAKKAEDIRAVRFLGDRGYIVTFRQIDPLFAFDLSDPTDPKDIADIEVSGFSTYLHPLDENHLLSVGYESEAEDIRWGGQIQGIKLQVFDVSQADNEALPKDERIKAVHTEVIGTHGSSSEALTNHLGFTLYRGKTLALPLTECDTRQGNDEFAYDNWKPTFSGLRLFDVSATEGFSKIGDIAHDGAKENLHCWSDWADGKSAVKRTVFLEDIAFAIAGDQVIVDHIDALDDDKTKTLEISIAESNYNDGDFFPGGGVVGIGTTEPSRFASAEQDKSDDQDAPPPITDQP